MTQRKKMTHRAALFGKMRAYLKWTCPGREDDFVGPFSTIGDANIYIRDYLVGKPGWTLELMYKKPKSLISPQEYIKYMYRNDMDEYVRLFEQDA